MTDLALAPIQIPVIFFLFLIFWLERYQAISSGCYWLIQSRFGNCLSFVIGSYDALYNGIRVCFIHSLFHLIKLLFLFCLTLQFFILLDYHWLLFDFFVLRCFLIWLIFRNPFPWINLRLHITRRLNDFNNVILYVNHNFFSFGFINFNPNFRPNFSPNFSPSFTRNFGKNVFFLDWRLNIHLIIPLTIRLRLL